MVATELNRLPSFKNRFLNIYFLARLIEDYVRAADDSESYRTVTYSPCPNCRCTSREAGDGWAVLVHERLGELEDERVLGIERNIHLASQNEILLRIDRRNSAGRSSAYHPQQKGTCGVKVTY